MAALEQRCRGQHCQPQQHESIAGEVILVAIQQSRVYVCHLGGTSTFVTKC